MRSYVRVLLTMLSFCGLTPLVRGEDQLADLLRRFSGTANTVAFVNVKAVRDGGGAKGAAVIAGSVFPPSVDVIAYATHLEPGSTATRGTYGLVRYNRAVTLKEIAEQTGGELVNVGDMNVVDTGRLGRVFALAPNLLGFGRQLNHQDFVRWKKFAEANNKVALHPYLAEAIASAGDAAIVGAVDLEHMLELGATCQRVSEAKAAEGLSKGRLDGCATLIVGLKGVCLTVRGKDLDQAEVRLDFGGPVGQDGELVKAMFNEALEDLGANIEDFRRAKVTVARTTVTLDVKLSDDGLTRIMSLFAAPPPARTTPRASMKIEANGVSVDATVRYWKTADQLLNELKRQTNNSSNYIKSATWHETYAERIEDLNTHYVDADVVKYTQTLMARLRALAWSLRGVAVEVKALEKGTMSMVHGVMSPGGYIPGVSPSWLGGGSTSLQVNTNLPQIREKQAEIIRKDAARRLEIWKNIDEDRRALIKTERERYGIELGK